MSLGLLVIAGNHFIVRGPEPSAADAHHLARRWSIISIVSGVVATQPYGPWQVSTKEFRENLTWAVIVERPPSAPAAQLLTELAARGVTLKDFCPAE